MKNKIYDLIVIGGGPAGMMAAIAASKESSNILLIEKNPQVGRKLLLSGSGRCNITNAKSEIKEFTENFGKHGKFLFSALKTFSVENTIEFFNKAGVETVIEENNNYKIFPKSDKASDILEALENTMRENSVTILTGSKVSHIETSNGKIESLTIHDKKLKAKNYLISTGGLSYPATGSTGEGYSWAEKAGHHIVETRPVLTPLLIKDKWISNLMGISLSSVDISIYENSKKITSTNGDLVFTHDGVSGPGIYALSRKTKISQNHSYLLKIDLHPNIDIKELDLKFQKILKENSKKKIKNCVEHFTTSKIALRILDSLKIDQDKTASNLNKLNRKQIINALKEFTLTIKNFADYKRAVVTAGGIQLKEIFSKTMQSKIVENLYFAGEIIDLDGPTGGYNLQLCWSTGYLAGMSAIKNC